MAYQGPGPSCRYPRQDKGSRRLSYSIQHNNVKEIYPHNDLSYHQSPLAESYGSALPLRFDYHLDRTLSLGDQLEP